MYQVQYLKNARKNLKQLDFKVAQRIIKKVAYYAAQQNPLGFAKRLTDSLLGKYRFRIGDYRVIFDVDQKGEIKILMILKVGHRRDVYDE